MITRRNLLKKLSIGVTALTGTTALTKQISATATNNSNHIFPEWKIPEKYHHEYYNVKWATEEPFCAAYLDLYCNFTKYYFNNNSDRFKAIRYLYEQLSPPHNINDFVERATYDFLVYGQIILDNNSFICPKDPSEKTETTLKFTGTSIFNSSINKNNVRDIFKSNYKYHESVFTHKDTLAYKHFEALSNFRLSSWNNLIVYHYDDQHIYNKALNLEVILSPSLRISEIEKLIEEQTKSQIYLV